MKLTAEENQHAVDIKEIVEGLPDLDNLSDFMYAQLAIVCKGNLEDVVERCYGLQEFRQEYEILDTYEQGRQFLRKTFDWFPEKILSFTFSEKEGTYVLVHNVGKFEPSRVFTSAEMVDEWLTFMYYCYIMFFPDLESLRKGVISVNDCADIGLNRDILTYLGRFMKEFLAFYPFRGQNRFFNAGAMFNILTSMLIKLLPEELRKEFHPGVQFDGNMADTFLVPSLEEAHERIRSSMERTLKRRYANENTFKLVE
jgi:hypothetical protein